MTLTPVAYQQSPATAIVTMRHAMSVTDSNGWQDFKSIKKTSYTPEVLMLLSIFRSFIQSLQELDEAVMQMHPKMAEEVLQSLPSDLPGKVSHIRIDISTHKNWPEEALTLGKLVVSVYDNLNIVAFSPEADEDSLAYKSFFDNMITEAVSTPRVHGRKALFDLFKD